MNGEFRASPDSIRASAASIRRTAESFGSHLAAFQARVQSLQEPPGNDMISPLIWVAHGVVFKIAMDCVWSNIRGMHVHADQLDTTARLHEATEQANVTGIDMLGAEV